MKILQLNKSEQGLILKKYLSIFIWGIVLSIIFASVLMRLHVVNSVFGFNFWVVRTESMTPKIKPGDLIVSSRGTQSSYKSGDVIVFETLDKTIVTHRIIEKNKTGFITKGDANQERDEQMVNSYDIQGKIIFGLPFLGKFFLMLQTMSGKILLIILISIGFVLKKLKNIVLNEKEEGYHEGKNMVE